MHFNSETPTTSMTIQGEIFTVAQPFTEGHPCAKNEAAALNQSLVENIRNNCAKAVKAAKTDGTFDQTKMQAFIDSYVEEYEFGVRGGRAPTDPVERAALDIAKAIVKNALREHSIKVADIDASEITRLAEEVVADNPDIRKTAAKQVADRAKLGASVDLSSIASVE